MDSTKRACQMQDGVPAGQSAAAADLDGRNHGGSGGGDAGHALHEVQRDALASQQATRPAPHLQQHLQNSTVALWRACCTATGLPSTLLCTISTLPRNSCIAELVM